MNTAFLYIKPHAATEKAKALVERELKNSGLSIVDEGTMQTNDIKTSPRIVHFNSATMPPDSQIYYYVVQWSEANTGWHAVRGSVGETNAQGIRGMIRSTWRELLLEEEPCNANDSLYFSDSALSGLADRLEWLGVSIESDPTGSAIASAGPELLEEARHWVRNVAVDGKPAHVMCQGFNTSELIAALKRHIPERRAPLEATVLRDEPSAPPPVADEVFVDEDFRNTEVSWSRLREALRSNPASLVPQTPCAEQISPADGINGCVVGALTALARHGRSNIDDLFVTKTVRSDGHYVVRLFRNTAWQDVSLDDAVPVSGGRVLYIDSRRGQWWPLLLYKALAKLWGSYRLLGSATFPDVMHALTGKPAFVQYLRPRTNSDGVEIAPTTGYLGDPSTSTFWTRLGNKTIKQEDIVVCRVSESSGPAYGLEGGASLVLADATKVEGALVFKVHRPRHTYKGPFAPGSEQLESSSVREALQYDEGEATNYFFAPQATLVDLTDYLVITSITADTPVVVSGPWERKVGLPGSTLFRRGVAIQCTNTNADDISVVALLKNAAGSTETSVAICTLRPRDGTVPTALLTGNLFVVQSASDLIPQEAALPLRLSGGESLTLIPVCDPVHDGSYAMLFYGIGESGQRLALSHVPTDVDMNHPVDYVTKLAVGEPGQAPVPLLTVTVRTDTQLHVLMKQLRTGDDRRSFLSDTYVGLVLFADPKDPPVAAMDKVWGVTEVALVATVRPGSYVVAAQCTKSASLEIGKTLDVRCTIFARTSAEAVLSDYRDREAENLADARLRERILRKSIDATNSRMNQHVTSIQITEATEVQGGAVAIDD